MKRILISVIVAVCSVLGADAQNGVDFSVKAGVGASGWMGSDVDGTNCRFAYRIGLGVEKPITQVWGFQSGLNFTGLGCSFENESGYDINMGISQLYLELPLMATARVNAGNGLNVIFNAGPYLSVGVGGKLKATAHNSGSSYSESTDAFGKDGLNRLDMGLGFGANFEFKQFTFGIDTRFGCIHIAEDAKAYNFALFLGAGYKF